jgi:hypothetical protein
MYFYPGKLFSQQDRQLRRERPTRSERYKKFFPLLQRYNFISDRIEQIKRNETEEDSSQVDKKQEIYFCFFYILIIND